MPAKSKAQQMAMAIAEHHPEKLYARNRGMLQMTKQQLHEYASSSAKNLPGHVKHRMAKALAHNGVKR